MSDASGCDSELLDEAACDPGLRAAIERLSRLARRGVRVLSLRGVPLHAAGTTPARGWRADPSRSTASPSGASRSRDPRTTSRRTSSPRSTTSSRSAWAETDKNALAGDILSKLQELSVLYDVADALANAHDIGSVGEEVHFARRRGIISPDWAGFVSYDPERSQVRIVALHGDREGVPRAWRSVEPGSYTWAALKLRRAAARAGMGDAERVQLRRDIGPAAERPAHSC